MDEINIATFTSDIKEICNIPIYLFLKEIKEMYNKKTEVFVLMYKISITDKRYFVLQKAEKEILSFLKDTEEFIKSFYKLDDTNESNSFYNKLDKLFVIPFFKSDIIINELSGNADDLDIEFYRKEYYKHIARNLVMHTLIFITISKYYNKENYSMLEDGMCIYYTEIINILWGGINESIDFIETVVRPYVKKLFEILSANEIIRTYNEIAVILKNKFGIGSTLNFMVNVNKARTGIDIEDYLVRIIFFDTSIF